MDNITTDDNEKKRKIDYIYELSRDPQLKYIVDKLLAKMVIDNEISPIDYKIAKRKLDKISVVFKKSKYKEKKIYKPNISWLA